MKQGEKGDETATVPENEGGRLDYTPEVRAAFAAESARRDALSPEERQQEKSDEQALGALASHRMFTDYNYYQPDSSKPNYNPYPEPPEVAQGRVNKAVADGLVPEGFKPGDPQPNYKAPFYNPYDKTMDDANRHREERAELVARGRGLKGPTQDETSVSAE